MLKIKKIKPMFNRILVTADKYENDVKQNGVVVVTAGTLKENLNEEDFAKLRTNFNIPSIGKLTCTYDRMLGMKKRFNFIKQIREKK